LKAIRFSVVAGIFGLVSLVGGGVLRAQDAKAGCPPVTQVDEVKETLHGVVVSDPYRWLEDQESPETRAWIAAQNACTQSVLNALPGREAIAKRLGELLRVDMIGLPTERGGKYFYTKRLAGQDLYVLYMRREAGAEEVLVDPAGLSADHTISVNFEAISDDGKTVAYGVRKGGEDEVSVHFIDSETRKELADVLPRSRYSGFSFTHDGSGIYYSDLKTEGPRVLYHAFGAEAGKDKPVFGDGYANDKIIGISISEDGRYLLVTVYYGSACEKSEVWVQDLKTGRAMVPVVTTINACFQGSIAGGTLYLQTNWKAPKWKLVGVPLDKPVSAPENWKEVVPEAASRMENFQPAGGKIIAQYSQNAASELKAFRPDGSGAEEIALPQIGTVAAMSGRWSSNEMFYSFQSFAVPSTIYRYEVAKHDLTTWAKPSVPVDSNAFEVKQVWYESKDKTKIPMFLFYKKGLKLDGTNPALMTAYGGFDVSETPAFRDDAIIWAEHGGVFALPNLRGGGEFGEDWHHAGMLEKKQNVFDDFFGAAEWLIASRYTNSSKLAITGRSNGGLLMGAAMTQRPELFGAIVCGYPLLDMIRYQKFLVARYWVTEYGSSEDAKQFPALYAYSPYHHVVKGTKYPAVLFLTGDSDTRVAPLHARKMTAKMQAAQGGDKPILLLYDTKLGHSEGRPVSKIIEEDTQVLDFFFWQVGITNFN
jgi:prolyl oligopeptidase